MKTLFPEATLYTIEVLPCGVIVRGTIPTSAFAALATYARSIGFPFIDACVGWSFDGVFFTAQGSVQEAARAMVQESAKERAGDDAELEWALGWDVGVSSLSTLLALGRSEDAKAYARKKLKSTGKQPPRDLDDVGRVVRLLDRFPYMAADFANRIVEAYPSWVAVAAVWPETVEEYRRTAR